MKLTEDQKLDVISQIAAQMTSDDAKDPAIMHYKACRRYADIYAPLLSDRSPVSKMMEAVQIPAKITSVEYEPTSTRYVVGFTAFAKGAQPERVRTERTDGQYGEMVRRFLRVQEGGESALVGESAVVYKYSEQLEVKNSHGGDKVRVTPFISLMS